MRSWGWLLRVYPQQKKNKKKKSEGVSDNISLHARWNSSIGKVIYSSYTFTRWDKLFKRNSDEQWAVLSARGSYWIQAQGWKPLISIFFLRQGTAMYTFRKTLWMAPSLKEVKPPLQISCLVFLHLPSTSTVWQIVFKTNYFMIQEKRKKKKWVKHYVSTCF